MFIPSERRSKAKILELYQQNKTKAYKIQQPYEGVVHGLRNKKKVNRIFKKNTKNLPQVSPTLCNASHYVKNKLYLLVHQCYVEFCKATPPHASKSVNKCAKNKTNKQQTQTSMKKKTHPLF